MFQSSVLTPSPKTGADNPFSALLISEDLIAGLGVIAYNIKSTEVEGWKFC